MKYAKSGEEGDSQLPELRHHKKSWSLQSLCWLEKQFKNSFNLSETATIMPLEFVHSDVCGKKGQRSLGGAE